jgi:hypothetical protein
MLCAKRINDECPICQSYSRLHQSLTENEMRDCVRITIPAFPTGARVHPGWQDRVRAHGPGLVYLASSELCQPSTDSNYSQVRRCSASGRFSREWTHSFGRFRYLPSCARNELCCGPVRCSLVLGSRSRPSDVGAGCIFLLLQKLYFRELSAPSFV